MAFLREPSEYDINSLCDVLGIPRTEAINRLKANSNNVDQAMNEYLDDPESTKYRWDESAFNTNREGETNTAGISFNVQGADEVPSLSHVTSIAPSRPPSRSNSRSPLERLSNASLGDANYSSALNAQSGLMTPQSHGNAEQQAYSSLSNLRPAKRAAYESDMWAVVPTKAMVDAESAHPPALARKRDIDAPAFLRQKNLHRLGSLLTIYSKIPLARNSLLSCGDPALVYGHNSEWWKGKPILRHDVLARMAKGEDVWGEDTQPDFTEELHRLLAFLDMSDRSYASADSLAETKVISGGYRSWTLDYEDKFFHALQESLADHPGPGKEHMITTGKLIQVMPSIPGQSEPDGQNEEEESSTSFIFLDLALDANTYTCVNSLYDALDHLLWSSALSLDESFPGGGKSAVLLKPAEVLTMRFGNGGLVKPCEIPAVFYADRYLDSHRELSLHFQTQIREIKIALKKLDESKSGLLDCAGQLCCHGLQGFNTRHDVRDCCTKIISYTEQLLERQKKDAQWRHHQSQWEKGAPYSMDDLRLIHTWTSPVLFTEEEKADQETFENLIALCKDRLEQAKRQLTECEEKTQELNSCLDVVRKRLTCQEDEIGNDDVVFRSSGDAYRPEYWHPTAKYLLRGVATTHELAYVCTRDADDGSSPLGHAGVKDQWWKVGYVQGDASPIKSEKVTLDDVLQAAGTECRHPILVYASEMALNQEKIPLSDALRLFVKADNRSFTQELAQESSQTQEVSMQDDPSPMAAALSLIPMDINSKRKHSEGSSVATNGSIRSDLADVDLTFDEFPTDHGYLPEVTQQLDGPLPLKLGGLVESLPTCQTDEQGGLAEAVEAQSVHHQSGHDLETSTDFIQQVPEMSERRGGVNPFLSQPGTAQVQQSIDSMDLEPEHDITNG